MKVIIQGQANFHELRVEDDRYDVPIEVLVPGPPSEQVLIVRTPRSLLEYALWQRWLNRAREEAKRHYEG